MWRAGLFILTPGQDWMALEPLIAADKRLADSLPDRASGQCTAKKPCTYSGITYAPGILSSSVAKTAAFAMAS